MNSDRPRGSAELHESYRRLEGAATRHEQPDLVERIRRESSDLDLPLLVMLVGRGNAGKSSLLNSLVQREVAPVGLLPKTWAIHVYVAVDDEQSEGAEFVFDDGRTEGQRNFDEARARLDALEASGDGNRLVHVLWRLALSWPPPGVAIVDTPGFGQDRPDVQARVVTLFGSEGFVVEATDPFDAYFGRADFVLWCVKATRLEDRENLEAVERLARRRPIHGVMTFADRVEGAQIEAVRRRRGELLGEYLDDSWHETSLAVEQVDSLRSALTSGPLMHAAALKVDAHHQRVRDFERELVRRLDAWLEALIENDRRLQGTFAALKSNRTAESESLAKSLARIVDSETDGMKHRLDGLWVRSGEDPGRFADAAQRTIDASAIQRRVETEVQRATLSWQSSAAATLAATAWVGRRFVEGGEERVPLPIFTDASSGPLGTRFEIVRATVSGDEGVAAGLVSGALAGVIGLALGPVGWVAAGLGYFVGKMSRKSESIDKVLSATRESLRNASESVQRQFKAAIEAEEARLASELKGRFAEAMGVHPRAAPQKAAAIAADCAALGTSLPVIEFGEIVVVVPWLESRLVDPKLLSALQARAAAEADRRLGAALVELRALAAGLEDSLRFGALGDVDAAAAIADDIWNKGTAPLSTLDPLRRTKRLIDVEGLDARWLVEARGVLDRVSAWAVAGAERQVDREVAALTKSAEALTEQWFSVDGDIDEVLQAADALRSTASSPLGTLTQFRGFQNLLDVRAFGAQWLAEAGTVVEEAIIAGAVLFRTEMNELVGELDAASPTDYESLADWRDWLLERAPSAVFRSLEPSHPASKLEVELAEQWDGRLRQSAAARDAASAIRQSFARRLLDRAPESRAALIREASASSVLHPLAALSATGELRPRQEAVDGARADHQHQAAVDLLRALPWCRFDPTSVVDAAESELSTLVTSAMNISEASSATYTARSRQTGLVGATLWTPFVGLGIVIETWESTGAMVCGLVLLSAVAGLIAAGVIHHDRARLREFDWLVEASRSDLANALRRYSQGARTRRVQNE